MNSTLTIEYREFRSCDTPSITVFLARSRTITEQNVDTQDTAAQISAKIDALRANLIPTSETFNEDVTTYTALLAAHTAAQRTENASMLDDAKGKLGTGINSLVESLKIGDLMLERINRVVWEYVAGEGEEEDTIRVFVNPSSTRKSSTPRAASANGDRRDLQAEYEAAATPEDRDAYAKVESELGVDGTAPDAKKRNSQLWSIKNRVAERASKDNAVSA